MNRSKISFQSFISSKKYKFTKIAVEKLQNTTKIGQIYKKGGRLIKQQHLGKISSTLPKIQNTITTNKSKTSLNSLKILSSQSRSVALTENKKDSNSFTSPNIPFSTT